MLKMLTGLRPVLEVPSCVLPGICYKKRKGALHHVELLSFI